ncbi:hypothetical protein, partial [Acetobacter tropicalis]|uniref:hypothetical protein n=1 Tax=Acetobacter tropicalis TaxID=104102 RepID=UPI001CA462E8
MLDASLFSLRNKYVSTSDAKGLNKYHFLSTSYYIMKNALCKKEEILNFKAFQEEMCLRNDGA